MEDIAGTARSGGRSEHGGEASHEGLDPPAEIGDDAGREPDVAFHDADRGLSIVGDAVIGNPPGRLSLLPERVIDDPARLRASLRRLLDLDLDTVLVGDGVAIREGGRRRLDELIAEFALE